MVTLKQQVGLRLSGDAIKAMQEMAKAMNVTQTFVVERAIQELAERVAKGPYYEAVGKVGTMYAEEATKAMKQFSAPYMNVAQKISNTHKAEAEAAMDKFSAQHREAANAAMMLNNAVPLSSMEAIVGLTPNAAEYMAEALEKIAADLRRKRDT